MALESELWRVVADWRIANEAWVPTLTDDTAECGTCATSEFAGAFGQLDELPHDLRHDLVERIEREVGLDDRAWWLSDDSDARTDSLVFEMRCTIRILSPAIATIAAEWLDPVVSHEIDDLIDEIQWTFALHGSDDTDGGDRD